MLLNEGTRTAELNDAKYQRSKGRKYLRAEAIQKQPACFDTSSDPSREQIAEAGDLASVISSAGSPLTEQADSMPVKKVQ